jgi:hypothetical protein
MVTIAPLTIAAIATRNTTPPELDCRFITIGTYATLCARYRCSIGADLLPVDGEILYRSIHRNLDANQYFALF